jgi:hypothetical protein
MVARRLFRATVSEAGLQEDLVGDGVAMTSELAANTLHAQVGTGSADSPQRCGARASVASHSELWLYLRGTGAGREFVCKVFDALPGWKLDAPPAPGPVMVPAQALSGRGLQVVQALSRGRWGHHLTRARLDGHGIRGKAVWFALPAPGTDSVPAAVAAASRYDNLGARQAAAELESMLADRGLAGRLIRVDEPRMDMSVISICSGLTIWCRDGAASLTTQACASQSWPYADLVDVAERAVHAYEEAEWRVPPAGFLKSRSRTGCDACSPA